MLPHPLVLLRALAVAGALLGSPPAHSADLIPVWSAQYPERALPLYDVTIHSGERNAKGLLTLCEFGQPTCTRISLSGHGSTIGSPTILPPSPTLAGGVPGTLAVRTGPFGNVVAVLEPSLETESPCRLQVMRVARLDGSLAYCVAGVHDKVAFSWDGTRGMSVPVDAEFAESALTFSASSGVVARILDLDADWTRAGLGPSGTVIAHPRSTSGGEVLRVVRHDGLPLADIALGDGVLVSHALSPCGQLIAFMSASETGPRLCIYNVNGTAVACHPTEIRHLVWSPDGSRLIAFRADSIEIVSASTGQVLASLGQAMLPAGLGFAGASASSDAARIGILALRQGSAPPSGTDILLRVVDGATMSTLASVAIARDDSEPVAEPPPARQYVHVSDDAQFVFVQNTRTLRIFRFSETMQ